MNKNREFDNTDTIGAVYADSKAQFHREYNQRIKQYKQKDRYQGEKSKLIKNSN